MQYIEPSFVSKDVRRSRGLYHSRGHKTRSYILHIDLLLAMSATLTLFHAHAHLSSRACVFSDPGKMVEQKSSGNPC